MHTVVLAIGEKSHSRRSIASSWDAPDLLAHREAWIMLQQPVHPVTAAGSTGARLALQFKTPAVEAPQRRLQDVRADCLKKDCAPWLVAASPSRLCALRC